MFESRFTSVVSSDMIACKLEGFVNDQKAKLSKVTTERVVMLIGNNGLLASLNPFSQEIPVELDLVMNGLAEAIAKRGVPKIQFQITIRPRRTILDSDAFHARATQLLKELKKYFATD